jgi:hypothetical protein
MPDNFPGPSAVAASSFAARFTPRVSGGLLQGGWAALGPGVIDNLSIEFEGQTNANSI